MAFYNPDAVTASIVVVKYKLMLWGGERVGGGSEFFP